MTFHNFTPLKLFLIIGLFYLYLIRRNFLWPFYRYFYLKDLKYLRFLGYRTQYENKLVHNFHLRFENHGQIPPE